MPKLDYIQRFIFDQLDARGCVVRLDESCEAIQQTHHYPESLARTLNQFAVAAVLLRDSIKSEASVTIQLRTSGAIKLLMADCLATRRVRAIAEYQSDQFNAGRQIVLNQFPKDAVLAITISPTQGERYQSIVPMEKGSLAECLEDYFSRSEQLPTWFALHANASRALGIALHALPPAKVQDKVESEEYFARLNALLKTLSTREALELDAQDILLRLFHQESCRLYDARNVEFGCVCSTNKSLYAIKSLGKNDVVRLIEEQKREGNKALIVDCHFCFQRYEFEFERVENLF